MRALTQGARALHHYAACQIARAALGDARARQRADLLVPLLEAWSTDIGCEGTSDIQAADLVMRELGHDDGGTLQVLLAEIAASAEGLPELAALAADTATAGVWMIDEASPDDRLAGGVPFTTMCAVAVAGWRLQRQLSATDAPDERLAIGYFNNVVAAEARGLLRAATFGARPRVEQMARNG